jgi:hypothetical protein
MLDAFLHTQASRRCKPLSISLLAVTGVAGVVRVLAGVVVQPHDPACLLIVDALQERVDLQQRALIQRSQVDVYVAVFIGRQHLGWQERRQLCVQSPWKIEVTKVTRTE